MTGAPDDVTPAERLSAVLAAAANPSSVDLLELDDADLAALAAEDDARRAEFDRILATSNADWQRETDSAKLRDALVRILTEIRGPALETVGPQPRSAGAAAVVTNAAAVVGGVAGEAAEGAGASTAPLPADAIGGGGIGGGGSREEPVAGRGDGRADDSDDENAMRDDVRVASQKATSAAVALGRPQALCSVANGTSDSFGERAKYIPMRLTPDERKLLRLLEGALNVSQYTDVVDVLSHSRMKTKQRIHSQIVDLCSILSGLYVACDYTAGQELIANRDFAENDDFFQLVFEVGRRHKIANPEKLRSTYGKLVFLLQDSASDDIARLLDFSCVKPLLTVREFLERRDAAALLDDPLVEAATQEIIPHGKSRPLIQRQIKEKERAVEHLARRYQTQRISDDDIRRSLYSIGDNNAYLRCNRDPCDELLRLLVKYFGPETNMSTKGPSLAIRAGHQGARLTHDHRRQYQYCLQSLTLWREICHNMYKLWYMAETDLFDPANPYHLRNTGQGLNRVQAAPRVAKVMYEVISTVQHKVGSWIGSSVVHLGDSMVPNALTFIDKYAQLQRILLPLSTVVRRIGEVAKDDDHVARYIQDTFGGVESARVTILQDFFRFAFDGSGGTNMFDSGACVDGRLTSCWNWGSSVEKKPYFPLFLLCGFTGFDGQSFD